MFEEDEEESSIFEEKKEKKGPSVAKRVACIIVAAALIGSIVLPWVTIDLASLGMDPGDLSSLESMLETNLGITVENHKVSLNLIDFYRITEFLASDPFDAFDPGTERIITYINYGIMLILGMICFAALLAIFTKPGLASSIGLSLGIGVYFIFTQYIQGNPMIPVAITLGYGVYALIAAGVLGIISRFIK